MQLTPYLNFDGNCAEAFAFYRDLFKGTITYQGTFADMPEGPPIPPEARGRIMHVHLQIGQQSLMGSDSMPGASEACAGGYAKPQGLWVSIGVESPDEGRRVLTHCPKRVKSPCRSRRRSGRKGLAWSPTALARPGW